MSRAALVKCHALALMLSDMDGVEIEYIPVNVDGPSMQRVIQFCEHHKNDPDPVQREEPADGANGADAADAAGTEADQETPMDVFDEKFTTLGEEGPGILDQLYSDITAANLLNAVHMYSICTRRLLIFCSRHTIPELYKILGVTTDFTDDEIAQIQEIYPFLRGVTIPKMTERKETLADRLIAAAAERAKAEKDAAAATAAPADAQPAAQPAAAAATAAAADDASDDEDAAYAIDSD